MTTTTVTTVVKKKRGVGDAASEVIDSAGDLASHAAAVAAATDPDDANASLEDVAGDVKDILDSATGLMTETQAASAIPPEPSILDLAKNAPPYGVRRMHDVLCPAFEWDKVAATYPQLSAQIKAAEITDLFGAQGQSLIHQCMVDASAVPEPAKVAAFAKAYGLLTTLPPELFDHFEAARAQGVQRFKKKNSKAPALAPADIQNGKIRAGQFKRPFITSGRANMKPNKGQTPRIPMQTHVPDPADFQRQLISAGHEATAPGSSSPSAEAQIAALRPKKAAKALAKLEKQRQFYTNNMRDQARDAFMTMHDLILSSFPELCPMGSSPSSNAPSPTQAETLDNGATNTLEVAKTKGKRKGKGKGKAGRIRASKKADSGTLSPKVLKSVTKNAVRDARRRDAAQISELTRRLEELERQPEPGDKLRRGLDVLKFAAPVASTPAPDASSASTDESEVKLQWLVKRAKSPNGDISRPALEELVQRVSPGKLVELMSTHDR